MLSERLMNSCSSKIQTMYLVIRCNCCMHLMTAPDHLHHILCPVCGVTMAIDESRVYVNCRDRETAADIASQLADIIERKGKDLSEDELSMLRQRFEAWERHTR